MRPIYSLDAGENPCRLSLMELSYVRWGTQSPICVSELIRRKFNFCFEIPVVLIRDRVGKYCVTLDLTSPLHQGKRLVKE